MKDPIACLSPPGTVQVGPSEREKLTYTAQCSTDPAQAPIYNCVCIHVYMQPRSPQESPFPNDFQASCQRGRQHVPHGLIFTGRGNVDGFIRVLLLGILAVVWAVLCWPALPSLWKPSQAVDVGLLIKNAKAGLHRSHCCRGHLYRDSRFSYSPSTPQTWETYLLSV